MKKIIASLQLGDIISTCTKIDFDRIIREGTKVIGILDEEEEVVRIVIKDSLKCGASTLCGASAIVS